VNIRIVTSGTFPATPAAHTSFGPTGRFVPPTDGSGQALQDSPSGSEGAFGSLAAGCSIGEAHHNGI
jgi:hypothetical protein